jgi:hypothetical protein
MQYLEARTLSREAFSLDERLNGFLRRADDRDDHVPFRRFKLFVLAAAAHAQWRLASPDQLADTAALLLEAVGADLRAEAAGVLRGNDALIEKAFRQLQTGGLFRSLTDSHQSEPGLREKTFADFLNYARRAAYNEAISVWRKKSTQRELAAATVEERDLADRTFESEHAHSNDPLPASEADDFVRDAWSLAAGATESFSTDLPTRQWLWLILSGVSHERDAGQPWNQVPWWSRKLVERLFARQGGSLTLIRDLFERPLAKCIDPAALRRLTQWACDRLGRSDHQFRVATKSQRQHWPLALVRFVSRLNAESIVTGQIEPQPLAALTPLPVSSSQELPSRQEAVSWAAAYCQQLLAELPSGS